MEGENDLSKVVLTKLKTPMHSRRDWLWSKPWSLDEDSLAVTKALRLQDKYCRTNSNLSRMIAKSKQTSPIANLENLSTLELKSLFDKCCAQRQRLTFLYEYSVISTRIDTYRHSLVKQMQKDLSDKMVALHETESKEKFSSHNLIQQNDEYIKETQGGKYDDSLRLCCTPREFDQNAAPVETSDNRCLTTSCSWKSNSVTATADYDSDSSITSSEGGLVNKWGERT